MHRTTLHIALPLTILLGIAEPASAEPKPEQPDEIITVIGETKAAEADASRALEEPELVTQIRVDEQTPASATVAEVVGRTVGAEVRSVGGLGGFASISVRGLGAGHTPILVDGVPLSRIVAVTADLSRFELHGFERIDLYRSAVPASLGAGGVGGALNLTSAVGDGEGRGSVSAGLGSFGARHLRGTVGGGTADYGFRLAGGYAGADGDYMFFNDNGTNLNPSDDTSEKRTNNGFDRAFAVLRAREKRGARIVSGGARVVAKRQGLPGIGSRQTERSSLESATGILDTTVRDDHGSVASSVTGFAIFDRQRVLDEGGEVGLGTGNSEADTASVGLAGSLGRAAPGAALERLTAHISGRGDWFEQRGGQVLKGNRASATAAVDGKLAVSERARLFGQLRVEVSRTATDLGDMNRIDIDPSPRLAALLRPTTSLSLKASAGYAVRQPTLVELFGDRGFLAGNPEIRAESGPTADAAIVYAPLPTEFTDDAFFEAAAFVSRPTDAIVYAQGAGGVARPFNIEGARLAGAELSATIRVARAVRVTANYTFLSAIARDESEALDGNAMPYRSRHQGYGQIGFERRRFTVWTDLSLTSGNYIDRANIIELPARAFVGAGGRLVVTDTVSLSLEAKNLTDNTVENIELDPAPRPDLTSVPRPVSDFFGYPLPGRAFYASVTKTL